MEKKHHAICVNIQDNNKVKWLKLQYEIHSEYKLSDFLQKRKAMYFSSSPKMLQ